MYSVYRSSRMFRVRTMRQFALMILLAVFSGFASPQTQQTNTSQESAAPKKSRMVGTVKLIAGETVTLTTDSGSEVTIRLAPDARLARMEPGQTDIKAAPPIKISDVQVGDRMLAAGTPSADGRSFTASTAVIMKKSDVAEKQEREREEWQRNGTGGVVKAVDAANGTITISTGTLASTTLLVNVSKDTVIRRYAPDSVKFEDAKPGTLGEIKPGDQLRARGSKSQDGKELKADEVVSGTFRSIPATAVSTDPANGTIVVNDLATKRTVTLKVGSESQMHQIPPTFAQGIAMRLRGGAASPAGGTGAGPAAQRPGEANPANGARAGGAHDFQRILNRMPPVTLNEVHKGDALMIVATEGTAQVPSTVIILLSGVEPILAAASPQQASTILSPWNLSTGTNAGTGDAP